MDKAKINNLLNEANQLYSKACKLKDEARKSKDNYTVYTQAANCYEQTADKYIEIYNMIKNLDKKSVNNPEEMMIFSEYYRYESEKCLSVYFYHKRDFQNSLNHFEKSKKNINNAINMLNKISRNEFWEKELNVWKFFRTSNNNYYNIIMASKCWDEKKYIDTLDYYTKSLENLKKILINVEQLVDKGILEEVYLRITIGNVIAMSANIQSVKALLAANDLTDIDQDQLVLKLLNLFYKCYELSKKAYDKNPEWVEYAQGSVINLNNIKQILSNNMELWKSIYIEFMDNSNFLKIMMDFDLKKFKEIKGEVKLDNSSMWKIVSFWPLFLIIILCIIFKLANEITIVKLIIAIVFSEILILTLGIFILRTSGFLSEEGFLKSISILLKKQFKL